MSRASRSKPRPSLIRLCSFAFKRSWSMLRKYTGCALVENMHRSDCTYCFPSLKKGSCEKNDTIDRKLRKISPVPSLPKRGTPVEREEAPNTYTVKFFIVASCILSPFEKRGIKGDLNFFTASGGLRGICLETSATVVRKISPCPSRSTKVRACFFKAGNNYCGKLTHVKNPTSFSKTVGRKRSI